MVSLSFIVDHVYQEKDSVNSAIKTVKKTSEMTSVRDDLKSTRFCKQDILDFVGNICYTILFYLEMPSI